jgi:hypothetical protein
MNEPNPFLVKAENIIGVTPPPYTIIFGFSNISGPQVKVMEITKDGIWVNPDVSVDDTAKAVLSALQVYIGNLIKEAVNQEREECAKECEEIAGTAYALWKVGADATEQGRELGAEHCAQAIRARGKQ